MFAKGPRFPPEKPSEVPGPGFYKLPTESRLEAYKKGAFLEKGERFSSEKVSDVPGPGSYNVAPPESDPRPGPSKRPSSTHNLTHLQQQIEALKAQNTKLLKEHQQTIKKYEDKVLHNESTIKSLVRDNVALQSQVTTQQKEHRAASQRETVLRAALEKVEATQKNETDRASKLATLQRKLQDLEKLHIDDKKRHKIEIEQLNLELEATRKSSKEQAERGILLYKQQEISDSKIKDLKKAILADQTEIKELRMKAQASGLAKAQAASHQEEIQQLKKTLQALEIKHRSEMHNRDSALSQKEKVLSLEIKRRELAEQQAADLKSKATIEAKAMENRLHELEQALEVATKSVDDLRMKTSEDQQQTSHLRETLARVTEAYGQLSASSIPLETYRRIEFQEATLRLRNIRLERRLADREALVEQLTDYCRQASEEKSLLASLLREAENDRRTLLPYHFSDDRLPPEDHSLIFTLCDASDDVNEHHSNVLWTNMGLADCMAQFYKEQFDLVLTAYASANKENEDQITHAESVAEKYIILQTQLDALHLEYQTAKTELSKKTIQIAEGQTREEVLNTRLTDVQHQVKSLEDILKQERGTNIRLVQVSHESRKNEERLLAELEEVMENLADAARYKEAHADLLSEVIELIQQNELAEAEADRLGKFNAEILGHTNPQQKIFYVDRIRKELSDTKHQLLKSTIDREDLVADNIALQQEVAAYKSIAVPFEQKPRNTRVRIERPPLAVRSINAPLRGAAFEITPSPQEELIDPAPMTLDEIM